MKKLIIFAAMAFLCQTMVFGQKEKSMKESEVPAQYVKDFQNQVKDAKNASWTMALDSSAYMVTYTDNEGTRTAMRFFTKQKGVETRYYIDEQYYPHAIKDSVKHLYPQHKISCIYARNLRNKMTYQARIVKMKGFLFWRKEREAKVLSFETNDCKMIEVIDEE